MTTPPALLLVEDGTRDERSAETFRSFVGELAAAHPEFPVAGAFTERARPLLADAVAELVADGTERFAAVPVTLVPAAGRAGPHGYAQGGIPAALAHEEEQHPGISCACSAPLGPHPSVLSVLERRLEEALREDGGEDGEAGKDGKDGSGDESRAASGAVAAPYGAPTASRTPHDRSRVTVLLVAGGSTDPHVNAEVHRAARLLWEGSGYAGVEAAFVSVAAPDVASGLDRCRKLGAGKVVVLPYFLFEGALAERVRRQSEGWAAANPDVEVRNAEVTGDAEELATAVLERYHEAVAALPEADPGDSGHAREE